MRNYPFYKAAIVRILVLFAMIFGYSGTALCAEVRYSLPFGRVVEQIYPNTTWLPEPYQKYGFTKSSLQNDGIGYDSVSVVKTASYPADQYIISIRSRDSNAAYYPEVHPAFINNNLQALTGVNKCKATPGYWNKNNPHADQPWVTYACPSV